MRILMATKKIYDWDKDEVNISTLKVYKLLKM